MQLDDLYRRVIMDHYQSPRNRGQLTDGTITVSLNNPSCGDVVSLDMHIVDGIVQDAKHTGEGCSISIASTSMMTAAVKGKKIEEALQIADDFSALMQGEDKSFEYEEIAALSGVYKFPARIKCATLAWNALKEGVKQYEQD